MVWLRRNTLNNILIEFGENLSGRKAIPSEVSQEKRVTTKAAACTLQTIGSGSGEHLNK